MYNVHGYCTDCNLISGLLIFYNGQFNFSMYFFPTLYPIWLCCSENWKGSFLYKACSGAESSLNFSNFSCMFLKPNNFSNLNFNCSDLLDLRNLQEQVKKAFCYQNFIWPFTVWINCSKTSQSLIWYDVTMGRRNDHPAIWWSNVYFDIFGIIQWDSGSVTLT